MTSTIEAVRHFAARTPLQVAARCASECLTYQALEQRARAVARELEAREIGVAGLVADNGPTWLVVDLAAQLAGTVLVPLPPFFMREQIAHALADSGADTLLVQAGLPLNDFAVGRLEPLAGVEGLDWCRLRTRCTAAMPAATARAEREQGEHDDPECNQRQYGSGFPAAAPGPRGSGLIERYVLGRGDARADLGGGREQRRSILPGPKVGRHGA